MVVFILFSIIFTHFLGEKMRVNPVKASVLSTSFFILFSSIFFNDSQELIIKYAFLGSFIGMTSDLKIHEIIFAFFCCIFVMPFFPPSVGSLGTTSFISVLFSKFICKIMNWKKFRKIKDGMY